MEGEVVYEGVIMNTLIPWPGCGDIQLHKHMEHKAQGETGMHAPLSNFNEMEK